MKIINIDTALNFTPNSSHITKQNNKKRIIEFDMNSWRWMHNLYHKDSIGVHAMTLFFGLMTKKAPIVDILGVGSFTQTPEFLKTVFKEYWIPFLQKYWISSKTVGVTFYTVKRLKDLDIKVPEWVDPHLGQAYCIDDIWGKNVKEYHWKWNNPSLHGEKDPLNVYYDRKVHALVTKDPIIRPDNLMKWVDYHYRVSNNMPVGGTPESLSVPYDTPYASVLEHYFALSSLEKSAQRNEVVNSTHHVMLVDNIDYDTIPFMNFTQTYNPKMAGSSKILSNPEFMRIHGGNVSSKVLKEVGSSLPPLENPIVNRDNSYLLGNPKVETIYTISNLWGGEQITQDDVHTALDYAIMNNVGVTSDSIKNGDYDFTYPGPGHNPVFVPKHTSKDNSKESDRYDFKLSIALGMGLFSQMSGKQSETAFQLSYNLFKQTFEADKSNMERAANQAYAEILKYEIAWFRTYKYFTPDSEDAQLFGVNITFVANFDIDANFLISLFEKGIYNISVIKQIIDSQYDIGKYETGSEKKTTKRKQIPKENPEEPEVKKTKIEIKKTEEDSD